MNAPSQKSEVSVSQAVTSEDFLASGESVSISEHFIHPVTAEEIGSVVRPVKKAYGHLKTTAELASSLAYKPGSFLLGRSIENDLILQGHGQDAEWTSALLGTTSKGHVTIVGDTRGGKGVGFIFSNLALWPGSAITIDPKGELASVTAEARGRGNADCDGMKQKVYVLDPERISQVPKDYFKKLNPLDWLDANDPKCLEKARTLAAALIPDEDISGDTYWNDEGRDLLAAIMAHVATDPDFDRPRTLPTVFSILQAGEVEVHAALQQIDSEIQTTAMGLLFEAMISNPSLDRFIELTGHDLKGLFDNAIKQWEGIRGKAKQSLSWVASPYFRDVLSESDFSFQDIRTDPIGISVYIVTSDPEKHFRWIRLLTDIFLEETKVKLPRSNEHETLLVLDEFPLLRPMRSMVKAMGAIAGYGVRICIVIQSIPQLQERYPKNWRLFLSSAAAQIYVGINCVETAKFACEHIGKHEVVTYAESISYVTGKQTNETLTHSEAIAEGVSTNASHSDNINASIGQSDTESTSTGGSKSHTFNRKDSKRRYLLPKAEHLPLYAKDGSVSTTKQQNKSGGRSQTKNASLAVGSTDTLSMGMTTTGTRSDSLAKGNAKTRSTSKSIQQQITKEDVLEPNQIFEAVASELDRDDPRFPGQALILMRGNRNFLVRTVRYYEDEAFYRRYSAHPDFGMQQAPLPYSLRMELKHEAEKAAKILMERKQQLRDDFFPHAVEMAIETHNKINRQFKNTVFHVNLDLRQIVEWQNGLPEELKGIEEVKDDKVLLRLKTGQPILQKSYPQCRYEVVEITENNAKIKVTGLRVADARYCSAFNRNITKHEELDGFNSLPLCESWKGYQDEWQSVLDEWQLDEDNSPANLCNDSQYFMKLPFEHLEREMENTSPEWKTDKETIFNRRVKAANIFWKVGLWIAPLVTWLFVVFAICGLYETLFTSLDAPRIKWESLVVAILLFGFYAAGAWIFLMADVESDLENLPPHPLLAEKLKD